MRADGPAEIVDLAADFVQPLHQFSVLPVVRARLLGLEIESAAWF